MSNYKCINKCYFRDRTWTVGEEISPREGEEVPMHFVPSEEFSKKKLRQHKKSMLKKSQRPKVDDKFLKYGDNDPSIENASNEVPEGAPIEPVEGESEEIITNDAPIEGVEGTTEAITEESDGSDLLA